MKLSIGNVYMNKKDEKVIYLGHQYNSDDDKFYHQFEYIRELKPDLHKYLAGYGQTTDQLKLENYKFDKTATILYGKSNE